MAIYIVSTIHYDLRESVTYWIYDNTVDIVEIQEIVDYHR